MIKIVVVLAIVLVVALAWIKETHMSTPNQLSVESLEVSRYGISISRTTRRLISE